MEDTQECTLSTCSKEPGEYIPVMSVNTPVSGYWSSGGFRGEKYDGVTTNLKLFT